MTSIFLDNKYTRWYYQLIDHRRQNKPPKGRYTESHHIIPESFYIKRTREGAPGWLEGNPNARSNKVRLTGREHALCHWLLTKMTEGVGLIKCQQAFDMMGTETLTQGRYMSRIVCRAYERNRIEVARIRSERMKADNPAQWPGVGEKIAGSKRGVKREPFSQEWRDAMSVAKTGENNHRYGVTVEESTRALQSQKASMMMWVNDGQTSKRIYKTDAQSYLDTGWAQGRHYVKRGPRGPYKKKTFA